MGQMTSLRGTCDDSEGSSIRVEVHTQVTFLRKFNGTESQMKATSRGTTPSSTAWSRILGPSPMILPENSDSDGRCQ